MQNFFKKIENRPIQNIIRFNTKILKINTLNKDLYLLGLLSLKRNYSDSVETKIKSENLKESNSKQYRKISQESIRLTNKNKKLNSNFRIRYKEWKYIWNNKFNKYQNIGKYLPTISDKLFFSYLQERKLNLKSKYTFNEYLSSSKIINYNFKETNQKIVLNSLYKILKSFFKTLKSLISFPILKYSPNKIKILLFYYVIPNKVVLKAKQNYHNYIRKNGKLFKDTILRSKLIKIMARFKMILFISKWKKNNNEIILSNLNKKTKSLSLPLAYKIYNGNFKNDNLTNQEIKILTDLGLSSKGITSKAQVKRPILNIKTIQYNLDKLIPFYKNLVSLLIEKEFKNILDRTNHFINIKNLNSNNQTEINKTLVNLLLNKLSVNKYLNIEKNTENLENLNIELNIETENKIFGVASMANDIKSKKLEDNSKLQLAKSQTLNDLNETNFYAQELNLIYSQLILLKEKIRIEDNIKKNYKKDIVYSLNFLNKLILFFIKLKNYKIKLAAKKKYLNDSVYSNLDNLNFEFEGVEELNLENLDEFYHSYSYLKIDRKTIESIQETKEIFKYLKIPTITEVVSLIKEQKLEFNEKPLIKNYSNPYGYKNANLLLITALLLLYRSLLKDNLNKINEKKIGSEKYLIKINEQEKFNIKNHNNFKNILLGNNESKENLNILSSIKSNNGSSLISLNKIKFKYLISFLENMFNKTIELELIRLKYPAHNSHILAQVLGLSSKRLKFFKMMRKLLYTVNIKHPGGLKYNFNIIPSYLSGIKIRLGGRLSTEKLIPRKTVKTYQIGSIARNKINFKDQTRLTLKNKRGAYSFTVITSHIFNTNKK